MSVIVVSRDSRSLTAVMHAGRSVWKAEGLLVDQYATESSDLDVDEDQEFEAG